MFTAAECQALAEEKCVQAEHAGRNRGRLMIAAEGWRILAWQLRRADVAGINKVPRAKLVLAPQALAQLAIG